MAVLLAPMLNADDALTVVTVANADRKAIRHCCILQVISLGAGLQLNISSTLFIFFYYCIKNYFDKNLELNTVSPVLAVAIARQ